MSCLSGSEAFFINVTATGPDIYGQMMRYYQRKYHNLGNAPKEMVQKEQLTMWNSIKKRTVEMTGSVVATFGGNSANCRPFEWLVEDAAKRAMAELSFFCDVKAVFVMSDMTQKELFAVVRISGMSVPTSQRGFCGMPCYLPIPACCYHLCLCCPRSHYSPCCFSCCRPPLNVDAVADKVKELLVDGNQESNGAPFSVKAEGEIADEERIYLNRKGFHDVNLDQEGHYPGETHNGDEQGMVDEDPERRPMLSPGDH